MLIDAFNIVGGLFAIFSNLTFLWPASYARTVDEPDRAFLFYLIALFTSPLYHLCLGFARACIFGARTHYVIDFWSANLCIPLTALYFVRFRHAYVERWIIFAILIGMGLLVNQVGTSLMTQSIISGASLSFVVVYLAWHRIVRKGKDSLSFPHIYIFFLRGILILYLSKRIPDLQLGQSGSRRNVYNVFHCLLHLSRRVAVRVWVHARLLAHVWSHWTAVFSWYSPSACASNCRPGRAQESRRRQ